jgi:PPE-repeat protein
MLDFGALDFGAFTPEFNSARIYAGPGSGSLMTAASAWSALAAELNATALAYDKVVTTLSSEEWLGPASAAMAAAVQPYVAWMTTTAAQAEQAALQAQEAAAAYEAALAGSVPPPVVAANRAEVAQLTATNVVGQNTPLIAQLEALYAEMWAQDATAMYTYAAQAALATKVTPFAKAPEVSNQGAGATQAAAVNNASVNSAAGTAQNALSKVVTSTPSTLQQMSSPVTQAAATGPPKPVFNELWYLLTGQTAAPTSLGALLNGYSPFAGFFYNTEGLPYFSVGMGNSGVQMAKTLGLIGSAAPAAAAPKALPALGGLGGLLGGGAATPHPAAAIGGAASIGGKLSVPVAWTGGPSLPAMGHTAIPVSSISAAPEAAGGPGNLLGGMPLAGMGPGSHAGAGPRYGFKPTVMARPPFAG